MKQEKSCGCIIIEDGAVLIEKQKHNEERLWSFPKGHQEAGETNVETALRETKEEVGLDVDIIDNQPIIMKYPIHDGTAEKTVYLFIAKLSDKNSPIVIQEAEVEEARWVPFSKVDELLTFESSNIAWHEALERILQKSTAEL